VRRREFITLLGGSAAAWPVAARAQAPQRERMRRIGVLTPFASDDAEGNARHTAFAQALQQLGWTVGQNVRIDYRWGRRGNVETMRKLAAELVALAPDAILAATSVSVSALQQITRTIPIVFVQVIDPRAVASLAGLSITSRTGSGTGGRHVAERSATLARRSTSSHLRPQRIRCRLFVQRTVRAAKKPAGEGGLGGKLGRAR
jgi:putative ABC transport system substrate-binding protein